jgi:ribosomal protein L37AE/L43A
MKKRYESIEKPEKCPKCGAPVYRILYGLPVMSEEEYFNTYHEHVIYGGCCISKDDPEWACSQCGAEIYNATHIPFTKKVAYAKLDAMLSEEDKKELKTGDAIGFHFSLGMWIRNNWIYEQNEEDVKQLAELFGDDSPFFEPDNLSDRIIKSYQRHLRGMKKKTDNDNRGTVLL